LALLEDLITDPHSHQKNKKMNCGGVGPLRNVDKAALKVWEKAQSRAIGAKMSNLGSPVQMRTQVVSGTKYTFLFGDGSTVQVWCQPWMDRYDIVGMNIAKATSSQERSSAVRAAASRSATRKAENATLASDKSRGGIPDQQDAPASIPDLVAERKQLSEEVDNLYSVLEDRSPGMHFLRKTFVLHCLPERPMHFPMLKLIPEGASADECNRVMEFNRKQERIADEANELYELELKKYRAIETKGLRKAIAKLRKEKEGLQAKISAIPLDIDTWSEYCDRIKSFRQFNPDRPLMSGPKHRITLLVDGFKEGDMFFSFDDSGKRSLLDCLYRGERPPQYSGGRCPHSVLVYDRTTESGQPPLSLAEWGRYCDAILSHSHFSPDRPMPSGPKYQVYLYTAGFRMGGNGALVPFNDARSRRMLDALRQGKGFPSAGGPCPTSTLVYDRVERPNARRRIIRAPQRTQLAWPRC